MLKRELYLASESPRRRELLSTAGYKFRVDSVKVSEIINENLNPQAAIKALAQDKARAFIDHNKHLISRDILVLSADTMVVLDEKFLGKPVNLEEARAFLDLLSGKMHSVITGFCLWDLASSRVVVEAEETFVEFKKLTPMMVQSYLDTGEPMGKAGAYAIQGQGGDLVKSFHGSWSNVVGLPLEKLEEVLRVQGWEIERIDS